MLTKIYWIHRYDNSAKIGIMARPRGNEWLEEEIAGLKKQQVAIIVSLLEPSEIFELGLEKEQQTCLKHGIDYRNFPIPDRGLPGKKDNINPFINKLVSDAKEGNNIVIHCRMGIGRSSIIAGAILLQAGLKAEAIIAHISKVRGLRVPDTDEQIKWLKARE